MDALYALQNRRSVRAFKPEPIEEKVLDEILAAGMNAPSGRNLQSPIMVVTSDPEKIAAVEKLNGEVSGMGGHPFYGAPTLVVVLADASVGTALYDGSLVMGNLLNAAYALGVGGRWVHRAKEVFASDAGKALLKAWGIEGDYVGVGNCLLGYPADGFPDPIPRKDGYVYRV